ncbi:MAG: RNA polymerase sigma factor [Gammaproteobacteria bacterium]|jgi:RNA polymerase sigma-70 factor (ECF subfamily)|nr:RNA polymerase sigma factor [Gammaproteobacteria bacterium]
MAEPKNSFVQRLFAEHGGPLLHYLGRRTLSGDEAADIAQDAWLRMSRLEHPERLRNARAFLYQTASNLAVDRARRADVERRFTEAQKAADPAAGHTPSPERTASADEDLDRVRAAIDELPLKCRQAFIMHRGRDMTYPEIANELHVSTSMVEKHIIHALKHLRRRLQG